jgi:putative membrane protein
MRTFAHVLLVALLCATAYADDTHKAGGTAKSAESQKDTARKEKLTRDELQVMAHYKELNNMEVELGKMAQKNGGSQAVKSYGEMLVKEHTENNQQLADLAKQTGQKIPKHTPETATEKQEKAEAKKHAAQMKKLEGTNFDREYLRMMVADHDKELAQIDTNIAKVDNSELADLLRNTKPVLQKHADQARELQKTNAQAMADPKQSESDKPVK